MPTYGCDGIDIGTGKDKLLDNLVKPFAAGNSQRRPAILEGWAMSVNDGDQLCWQTNAIAGSGVCNERARGTASFVSHCSNRCSYVRCWLLRY